jgi:hypothetical protein
MRSRDRLAVGFRAGSFTARNLKVGQGVGGWGLAARIQLPDGKMFIPVSH